MRIVPILLGSVALATSIWGIVLCLSLPAETVTAFTDEHLALLILYSIAIASSAMSILFSLFSSAVDLIFSVLYGLFCALEAKEHERGGKLLRLSIAPIICVCSLVAQQYW
jgi:hypothetical protein